LPGKNILLRIRVDDRLFILLDECSKITGKNRSRLARDGIRKVVEEILRGRGGHNLWAFFQEIQFHITQLDVPAIRESLVTKLQAAIDDVHAKAQKTRTQEMRLEYYRVMGYLCQILNGLLENVETDELMRRLEEAKAVVKAHQTRTTANG